MDTASFSPISLNDVIPTWNDAPDYVLSIIRKIISGGIGLWIFIGETDGRTIVSSARYALNRFRSKTIQEWNPWYVHKQLKLHIGLLNIGHFWGALSTRESSVFGLAVIRGFWWFPLGPSCGISFSSSDKIGR
ncbi:unnamed protein product [Musa acuminata subsp. burmannicoides]